MGTAVALTPNTFASSNTSTLAFESTFKKIKVGIIGCGSVSGYYIPHLLKSPFAEIVSVCDIKPERAQNRAKEFNISNWYPHIDKMLAGEPFDLMVNLTDMQEHGRLNRIAINSGKNVWSEKPMANTYKEGKELQELAEKQNVKIWGAPVVVNSPQFAFMAKEISDGNVGRISAAHGCYGHLGPSWSSFFYEKLGGSLPDLGVYNITTLTGLLGPVVSVTAMLNIVSPTREIENKGTITVTEEDNAHILLEHKSGAISHIQCGFNYTMAHSYESEEISTISIIGTKARMDMIGYDWAPFAVDVATPAVQKMQRMATDSGTYSWQEGASVICEHLATGKELLITTEHTLHVTEIIEAARKSQETGQRIKINSTFNYEVLLKSQYE
jgi:predicted dehydrogenase